MASFDDVFRAADTGFSQLYSEAKSAIDTLKTIYSYTYGEPKYPASGGIALGSLDRIVAEVDEARAALDGIRDYIARIDSIKSITLPSVPTTNVSTHYVWDTNLEGQIETNLRQYISTMGIPDVKYQNSIFNEDYERNLQNLNDLLELADAKTGARGFTYTNDFGTALKLDAQQKYQFDRTQVSRSISKLLTEWARQNYQFAIEKGIGFETFHADFAIKYATTAVNVYAELVKAEVERFRGEMEMVLAPLEALVKQMAAELELVKVMTEVDKTNATLKLEANKILVDEAISRFNTTYQQTTTKSGYALEGLKTAATQASSMAQAVSNSAIGIVKG